MPTYKKICLEFYIMMKIHHNSKSEQEYDCFHIYIPICSNRDTPGPNKGYKCLH